MKLTSFERRWLEELLWAMIPKLPELTKPSLRDALPHGTSGFIDELQRAAPPLFAVGLRISIWVLYWSPTLLLWRSKTFGSLDEDAKDALLVRAANHGFAPLRQVVLVVKLVACFAHFSSPITRTAFGGRS